MNVIEVEGLRKTFELKQKAPGLRGSLRAVWRPVTKLVDAVRGVSFSLEEGELLAFIGPNGAGKSTTIKMLTGILYPSGGRASVLGYVPWKERRKLSYHIGSVFGQKPQLWYHLPPEDTFRLFARIYELDMDAYRERRAFLVEAFQLGELLQTPVRKLSLGQRMKCEIAASLLHRPRLIFLDEPTIGLDVVAKQQIREAIRTLNETENTTIFLTSHDAGDVENLCKRVIVVNHGRIIFDDRTSVLKRQYLTRKIVDVRFSEPLNEPFHLPGVTTLKQGTYGVKLEFDGREVPVERVVQQIIATRSTTDINISDPPMEEIIREIYTQQE
ncbi:MAG: ATP-binding cassette domain-containing protein [Chloroflexi bacterium]|nr:ATP-binding cassette domain-containing protein [Chloroflexota bacterium]MCI0580012.1 ATP-binding cassette domain-containing protein [Chloroflexota bacterium]MCI0648463.1 ATP-binding cassette domain-containing protein [Chloroflexota bacterium]MCI0726644.1 ATP-binding cassette domain-containing protein [Chloroflexota bacterium]